MILSRYPMPSVAFTTVFEDRDVIVVDKPAGLVVHPGAGHDRATLVNGLLARYPELAGVGDPYRPGIVHRLDRGTSGLAGRSPHRARAPVIGRADAIPRTGEALRRAGLGTPRSRCGGRRRPRRPVEPQPPAHDRDRPGPPRTHALRRWSSASTSRRRSHLLACRLETGRTHQIRVHLRAIGHAVVGDPTYGAGHATAGRGGDVLRAVAPVPARSLPVVQPPRDFRDGASGVAPSRRAGRRAGVPAGRQHRREPLGPDPRQPARQPSPWAMAVIWARLKESRNRRMCEPEADQIANSTHCPS